MPLSHRLGDALGHVCLTYRKTVLLAVAAVTVLLAAQLPKLKFENSLGSWFLARDPALLQHDRFTEEFGSDELIIIGLEAPDVFAPDVLRRIDRVTRAVERAPNVEKVFSLTNIESVSGRDGALDVGDLVEFPINDAEATAIRARALTNETYLGNVVNATGTFTAILARLPYRVNEIEYKRETTRAIEAILAKEDASFVLSGSALYNVRFLELSERDLPLVTGIMTGLLLLILWILFRSPVDVAVPATTVGIATLWSVGWILLVGRGLTIVSEALPPLMMAVGVADAMHLVVDYELRLRAGTHKQDALRQVYRYMTWPCLFTSLTTCAGMLSLCVSRVRNVSEFGLFAAIGVFGAFVLAMTLVPIALSYLPEPHPERPGAHIFQVSGGVLNGIATFAQRHGRLIFGVSAALLLGGLALATRVRVESGLLQYFRDGHRFKTDTRTVERNLAGMSTLEIVVDTGRPGGVKAPATLAALADFQAALEAHPEVSASHTVTGVFKDLRRAFFDNDPREYRLPETEAEAAQYLLLYELDRPDGDLYEYVDYGYRKARLSARVSSENSTILGDVLQHARRAAAAHLPPSADVTYTGTAVLWAHMEDYIRESLLVGMSLALVSIYVLLSLQARSFLLGAIAMVPNVVPIVVGLGFMGVTNIALDASTVLSAPIMLGLAVDNTIHFIVHTREQLDRGTGLNLALWRTTVQIGRALIFTTIVLAASFVAMLFGAFTGVIHFALLCLVTLAVALPADLLLLPSLLRVYARWRHPEWLTHHDPAVAGPAGAMGAPEPSAFDLTPAPQRAARPETDPDAPSGERRS